MGFKLQTAFLSSNYKMVLESLLVYFIYRYKNGQCVKKNIKIYQEIFSCDVIITRSLSLLL
jgi:hypothetical protein